MRKVESLYFQQTSLAQYFPPERGFWEGQILPSSHNELWGWCLHDTKQVQYPGDSSGGNPCVFLEGITQFSCGPPILSSLTVCALEPCVLYHC